MISPLTHITSIVPDVQRAGDFLREAFACQEVEEGIAGLWSTDGHHRSSRVAMGSVVVQFIQPLDEESPFWREFRERGPGVWSLAFWADDPKGSALELSKVGAAPLLAYPLTPDASRHVEGVREDAPKIHFLASKGRLGFHLEIWPKMKGPDEGWSLHPVYTIDVQKGQGAEGISPLVHVEIVVLDVDESSGWICDHLGGEPAEEEFASFLDTPFMRIRHIKAKEVILQLCQPLVPQGSWYEQLKNTGPGVHNLTFVVEDISKAVQGIERAGGRVLFSFSLEWEKLLGPDRVRPDVPPVHMMDTRSILGFHLELSESPVKDDPMGA